MLNKLSMQLKVFCLGNKLMELLVFFAALFIGFSILLTPCLCMQNKDQSSSLEQASSSVDEIQFSLPRKLRILLVVTEESPFKAYGDQVSTSTNNKHKADLSGKAYEKKENKIKERRSGTRQEWDRSEYFTMDYSHVRRRRPIHNKSLPVGP